MTNSPQTPSEELSRFAQWFDPRFGDLLLPRSGTADRLVGAMRYAALAPGKRIRPYLLCTCGELVGASRDDGLLAAAAIECVHAFSLVHDDLPAMDDDDLRRGLPACHRKFDEATAILAGDALQALAFELLAGGGRDAQISIRLVHELAAATGWQGMIGGQSRDVGADDQRASVAVARFIHERKTAALFRAACRMGAIAAGGSDARVDDLGRFGHHLGVAFQIADDLLDVEATTASMGKSTGKDQAAGKRSYPAIVGVDEARRLARAEAEAATDALASFGSEADPQRRLADFVLSRDY